MMRNRIGKWMCGVLLLLLTVSTSAQDYEASWKRVKAFQQKGLPKSAAAEARKLFVLAQEYRNVPQMLRAYLVWMQNRADVSADSLDVDIKGLVEWVDTCSNPMDQAVLKMVAGSLKQRNLRYSYRQRQEPDVENFTFFKQALALEGEKREALFSLLVNISATAYVPMIEIGEASEVFGHDMLSLFRQTIVEALGEHAVFGAEQNRWVRELFERDEIYYRGVGRMEAALQVALQRDNYRIGNHSREVRKAELELLLERYKGCELCAEVEYRLAQLDRNNDAYADALSRLRRAISSYPRYSEMNKLKQLEQQLLCPSLTISAEQEVYAGERLTITVTSRNVLRAEVSWYRLSEKDVQGIEQHLNGNRSWMNQAKRSAKKVATHVMELDSLPFRFTRNREIAVTAPDKNGFYLLEVRPLACGDYPVNKVEPTYLLQCVTSLKMVVFPVTDCEQEVHVLDARTGHPVSGVVLRRWKGWYNKGPLSYRLLETLSTDEKGVCRIPFKENNRVYLQAVSGQDKGMLYAQQQGFHYTESRRIRNIVQLYTDRSLYRPGQQVQLSLLSYRQGPQDSAMVIPNRVLQLQVTDYRNKEVSRLEVKTDEYGAATATFDLPATCESGSYRIRTEDGGNCTFRVEEYKRPTFDVQWLPVVESYVLGDTVVLRGRAETFNGLPVQHARVIVNSVYRKMSWFYTSDECPLRTDTLLTDADGCFCVHLPLILPEGIELDEVVGTLRVRPYSRFCVTAQVTSAAGESHEASYGVPVSRQPLQLMAQIPDLIECKANKEWLVQLYNLNHEPLSRDVKATLVHVADQKEVWTGTIPANKAYMPSQLDSLESGRYRLQLVCDSARWEGEFVLFSLTDRQPADSVPLWTYTPSHEIDEEHPVRWQVGSSLERAWLIYEVHDRKGRLIHEEMELNNEVRMLEFPYLGKYGDGLRCTAVLVYDGTVYTQSTVFQYRQPERQLKTEWVSFRDKLQPGEKETWKLRVTLPDGKPADARVMTVMYDASLDALARHHWPLYLAFTRNIPSVSIWRWVGMDQAYTHLNFEPLKTYRWTQHRFDRFDPALLHFALAVEECVSLSSVRAGSLKNTRVMSLGTQDYAAPAMKEMELEESAVEYVEDRGDSGISMQEVGDVPAAVKLRNDFRETAFFLPMLYTDAQGEVKMEFTLPDALTEWHLIGVAHTRDMYFTDRIDEKVRAQKLFSVQPALPRFLREGDETTLNANIQNMSGRDLQGTLYLELTDSTLTRIIHKAEMPFKVESGGSVAATFRYTVEAGAGEVICRMYAKAENYIDGEQQRLPLLSDKVWVEESRAVYLNETQETISLKALLNGGQQWNASSVLTAEITHNPLWTVMQSLSSLAKPNTENAVDLASAYYAQSLLLEIARLQPSWAVDGGISTDSLSAYGWLAKLEDLQLPDGGFSWFKGMHSSLYITRLVTENLVRLQHICHSQPDAARVARILKRSLHYLDQQAVEIYRRMQEEERKHKIQPIPDENVVHYLYLCALQNHRQSVANREAVNYFVTHLPKALDRQSILTRALSSVVLAHSGKPAEAESFLRSVMEYSVSTEELGRYFDTHRAEYSWRNYRIPTQTLVIEALNTLHPKQVKPSSESPALSTQQVLGQLAQWLLNQKRTQQWDTSAATVDALYALWLACPQARVSMTADKVYEKRDYTAIDYPKMPMEWTFRKDTTVHSSPMAWAAVSVRSLVPLDEVIAYQPTSGLKIVRTYYKETQIKGKTKLYELKAGQLLQVGDKVVCRLTISTDRDMDFVTINASRPACLEPVEQLSGYRSGCYQSPGDKETRFCIDQMRKGVYTFDEVFYVTRTGLYHTGVAKVCSTYSPEFNAHTESTWINVKGE